MTVMSSLAPLFLLDATLRLKWIFRGRLWKHAQHGLHVLCGDGLAEKATFALRDQKADMDTREWAERYLAGMTDMPREEFLANRRAQS